MERIAEQDRRYQHLDGEDGAGVVEDANGDADLVVRPAREDAPDAIEGIEGQKCVERLVTAQRKSRVGARGGDQDPVVVACNGYFDEGGSLGDAICEEGDRKSTRLNSSHLGISYAVFCL